MSYAPAILGDKMWEPWEIDLDRYRGPDPASVIYGTAATRGATNTTVSVTAPAGTKLGDLLVAFATTAGNMPSVGFASSLGYWNHIANTSAGGYPRSEGGVWFRYATEADVAGTADVWPVAAFNSLAYAASVLIACVPGRNWVAVKGSGYSSSSGGIQTGTTSPQTLGAYSVSYNTPAVETRNALLFSMAHFGHSTVSAMSVGGTGGFVERAEVINPTANMVIASLPNTIVGPAAATPVQWTLTWGGGVAYYGQLWFSVIDKQGSHVPSWASGAGSLPPVWQEISPSAPFTTSKVDYDLILSNTAALSQTSPPYAYNIELAVGPAGSEVLVGATIVSKRILATYGVWEAIHKGSFEAYIKKGQRVAMRTALTQLLALDLATQNAPGSVDYSMGQTTGLRLRMIG